MFKTENLESEESSSSDKNECQELAEVMDKTQGINQGQTNDSSGSRIEFRTLDPGPSQPRTARFPSRLEHLLGSGVREPGP